MSTYRCSQCSTNWPLQSDYQPCPECGVKTDSIGNANPIDAAEAASRKRHADFEKFYEQHEAKQITAEVDDLIKASAE